MKVIMALLLAAALSLAGTTTFARGSGGARHSYGSSGSHSGSHAGSHSGSRATGQSGKHSGGKSHSSSGHHSGGEKSQASRSGKHGGQQAAVGVKRDHNGKIQRSARAKNEFKKSHPCPSTGKSSGACPGYVIDHVRPLKRGGPDSPSNMQWQSKAAAKEKDARE